jgi:hypothetical protein
VILLVLALVYTLLQPLANRQFGWQLPSLQGLLTADRAPAPKDGNDPAENDRSADTPANQAELNQPGQAPNTTSEDGRTVRPNEGRVAKEDSNPSVAENSDNAKGRASDSDESALLYGVLRSEGREVYVSPAGLRYTRGSVEGHRLKHLERHLSDQPERSDRHGVFNGDMPQVLRWIDDGYQRARQSEPGTRQRQEQGRTVYEADFPQPIGFVGGREGNRRGRPATKQLRVVTEEDRVITAFPY